MACDWRERVLLAARWLGAEARGVELLAEHVTCMAHWLAPAGITLVQGDAAQADLCTGPRRGGECAPADASACPLRVS